MHDVAGVKTLPCVCSDKQCLSGPCTMDYSINPRLCHACAPIKNASRDSCDVSHPGPSLSSSQLPLATSIGAVMSRTLDLLSLAANSP
jgi:hypothetical protein